MTDPQTPPGPAVDLSGQAVIDPSKNVLDRVELENKRQDDLREASDERQREVAALRERHASEVLTLRADLGNKETECTNEKAELRAQHAAELMAKETERLDAIRQVDTEQVQRAAEVQATQQGVLATQVVTSAETLRASVAAAAQAAATTLTTALQPIIKDIADLRQAQYEAQGQKAQVSETRERGGSTAVWIGVAAAGVFGFLGLVATAITVVVLLTSGSP